jgi:hypothetical protein
MWFLNRLRLFLSIVWRVWDVNPDDGSNYRLSIGTAWAVACGVWKSERQEAREREREAADTRTFAELLRQRLDEGCEVTFIVPEDTVERPKLGRD